MYNHISQGPTSFYLRPVLAFSYCLSLHLSVCPRVNPEFVCAITCDPFKPRSPNLDQRWKTPWLRSLLFCEVIDCDLQSQIYCILQVSLYWSCAWSLPWNTWRNSTMANPSILRWYTKVRNEEIRLCKYLIGTAGQGPLLLTWFSLNLSMN